MKLTLNKTNNELFITSVAIIACVLLTIYFPAENTFQEIASGFAFFVVAPIFYIKMVLKRPLSEFGFQRGDEKKGLIWSALLLVVLGGIIFLAVKYADSLAKEFLLLKSFKNRFWIFVLYEISAGAVFFSWEVFFRGFVLHYFDKFFSNKVYSVIWQTALFVLFFALFSKFSLNWAVAFFALLSFFAGVVMYKGKSIIYSFTFFWIAHIILSLTLIKVIYS